MYYPLLFEQNLHTLVWGSERWEISAISNSESVVSNGDMAGQPLSAVIEKWGAALVGKKFSARVFPLLVKFIDAHNDLSIQVHPNDALSQARHGKLGKTEMWYVMNAEPGASLLAGFKTEISPADYAAKVADGSIVDCLARHEVHPGDVFFIPAGRVHAICGGITLCEIQQSSDVTYRLFDYNRLDADGKPRQLHTEEARDAIDYKVYPDYRTAYPHIANGSVTIVDCPFFTVNLVNVEDEVEQDLLSADSFVTLSCLSGTCHLETADGEEIVIEQGTSCLVPASQAHFVLTSIGSEPLQLLESLAK